MDLYRRRLEELRDLLARLRRVEELPGLLHKQEEVLRASFSEQRASLAEQSEREEKRLADLSAQLDLLERTLRAREQAIQQLAKEKTLGFPWLAEAYEEFLTLQDELLNDLLRSKDRPAPKAAEAIREARSLRRLAEKKAKVFEYVLRYYEALFPWLSDLRGEDVDDLLIAITAEKAPTTEVEVEDAARQWLTDAEYASLPAAEKYQLALDRYWRSRKRPWQLGRDYERYVGYIYETQGFAVYYQGIVEGLEDLGRDLVATKGDHVEIVQCKYWAKQKTIHEKHINQLFGTATAYRIDHPNEDVLAVFYTSTSLSPRAMQFADILDVRYVDNFPLSEYPWIKCNVSRRDGSKIYHLPFDQQYDRTIIEEERLECYVKTVAEAEALGFRRAMRWRGGESAEESLPRVRSPSRGRSHRRTLR